MFTGQFTGIVGRDPEVRFLENGSTVANFSIAVRQPRRQGVEPPARWVKVSIWGKSAQFCADNVRKGDRVLVWGEVDAPETYQTRAGATAVTERFKAQNIEKMYGEGARQGQAPTPAGAPAPAPAPAPVATPPAAWQGDEEPPF